MCEGAYATLILFVRAFITLARTSFTTSGSKMSAILFKIHDFYKVIDDEYC